MASKQKFLNGTGDVSVTDSSVTMYNNSGDVTDNENVAFAKKTQTKDGKTHFYLLFDGGKIVNVKTFIDSRKNRSLAVFKPVKQSTFDIYIYFMKTKIDSYYDQTVRSNENDR